MWRRDKKKQKKENEEEKPHDSKKSLTGGRSIASVNLPLSDFFNIKYKLVKTEQFDNYMKALGINVLSRKIGFKAVPTLMILDHDGESYLLHTSSLFLNIDLKFNFEVPFPLTTPDGRNCTVEFSYKPPNLLTEVQKGTKTVIAVRDFSYDAVHMTLYIDKIICKMTYLHEARVSDARKMIHATSPQTTIMSDN